MLLHKKYLKYKTKYLLLKNQIGGNLKRILKEINEIKDKPIPGVQVKDLDEVNEKECSGYKLNLYIDGPTGTFYEGGRFIFEVVFPKDYPFMEPKFKLMNRIFHPNFIEGGIWIKKLVQKRSFPEFSLSECWNVSTTISDVIKIIIELLKNPDTLENIGTIVNHDALELFNTNKDEYNKIVKDYIQRFAKKPEE